MNKPAFEYVPIIADAAACVIRVAHIAGLSTKHGDTKSDRGRLHGRLTSAGGSYTLELFSDFNRESGKRVLSGTTASLNAYFDLTAANSSEMSGRAYIESCAASTDSIVILPTFAVDHDVLVNQGACAKFPGYDPNFGFSFFHAQAVRQIVAADLPRAVPYLFPKGTGLSAVVPLAYTATAMPDITRIANADQLRVAQASLVKAIACEQAEHVEEFADIAKAARARYEKAMKDLADANVLDEKESETFHADRQITVGSFIRL